MSENEREEVCDKVVRALTDFIIRVSKGETTSEKEREVLPEVAKTLWNYLFS